MKLLRNCLIGLAMLLLGAFVLLWLLPARWVASRVEPQLHGLRLQQVGGSVWDGHARAVFAGDTHAPGQLQWQLSRRFLLGQLQLRLQFTAPTLSFSGEIKRLPGDDVEISHADIRVVQTTGVDAMITPWGQPRGELQLSIPHAVLRAGWPMQMDAQATWHRALMHTTHGDVVLGDLNATAQARSGVISAQLQDVGRGPLQVESEMQLSPLGWRLDATLRARQTDPALRRWLATLGPPSADGSVHIQRRGGLAGSGPALPTN